MKRTYPNRKLLRTGEGWWTRLEGAVNRVTGPAFNPLYHLGTLTIFLFIVLLVTGVYLTLFYRPGTEAAYSSVERISAGWFGSLNRTIHRYAADALAIVVLLHMVKMFLSERFWGSRWFAWVTGLALLGLSWLIGTMGYFLIWDRQSQWMTEYGLEIVRGAVAQTFLGANAAARTYAFFVIILFLHVFLGLLIVFGVLLHVIRLNRARFWAPRWLMVEAGIVLVALALWKPVASNPPADLNQMVGRVVFDGWYFGFMLLAERFGNFWVWGVSLAVMAVAVAAPWLFRGTTEEGPAIVVTEDCTGCGLCEVECPYHAIEMVERNGEGTYKLQAVVLPDLCTSCGVCVGACATFANQLPGRPTSEVRNGFLRALKEQSAAGRHPILAFTCQRHDILGSFSGAGEGPLVRVPLPCTGYLPPGWVDEALSAGASDVVIVSCPADDCSSREGPRWLAERSRRRRALEHPHHHWIEAAPGDRRSVERFLAGLAREKRVFTLPGFFQRARPRLASAAAGLALLLAAFGLALLPVYSVAVTLPDEAAVRVVIVHQGVVKTELDNLRGFRATLPPGVSPEQFMGGERYPVRVWLEVDGELILDETFQPGGVRHESAIYGFAVRRLPAGLHHLRVLVNDDDGEARVLFDQPVEFGSGQVRTLTFEQDLDAFSLR